MSKYKSSGTITAADFKSVEWEGTTKGGKYCKIKMAKAINMGNIDWTFAEKDDTVAQIVFTGVYPEGNYSDASVDKTAPFEIEIEDGLTTGAGEIILGAGVFSIGGVAVGLTRGGGQFTSEREFREIKADGDRGPVEGRVVLDAERPTLTMNALQILTNVANLYPAIAE